MPKFDAGHAVEAMEYDFTKYGGSKGELREPSQSSYEKYIRQQAAIGMDIADAQAEAEKAEKKLKETGDRFNGKQVDELMAKIMKLSHRQARLTSELFGGSPSEQEIIDLPARVQRGFYTWVEEQFSPEGSTSGTNS